MNTQTDRPAVNPAGSVMTIVRLAREGRLAKGDQVSTDRLGMCEVLGIVDRGCLRVRQQQTGQITMISGIDFPPSAVLQTPDPRSSLVTPVTNQPCHVS